MDDVATASTDFLDDDCMRTESDLLDKLEFLEPYVSIKRSTSNLVLSLFLLIICYNACGLSVFE